MKVKLALFNVPLILLISMLAPIDQPNPSVLSIKGEYNTVFFSLTFIKYISSLLLISIESKISNFSFYYAHHISTIEGGMICTNNEEIYQV